MSEAIKSQKSEVDQQRLVRHWRAKRKKHLRPLCYMPIFEILNHIDGLKLQSLRALKSAMDSCSSTNCWWAEYEVAQRFRGDVQKRITFKSNASSEPPAGA